MTIKLYKCTSERTKLTKTLEDEQVLTGTLRDGCDILNPVIMVTTDLIDDVNYAYIPSFDRYYFISGIRNVRNGMYEMTLAVDVLMSFATEIKNLSVIISDTEETGANKYLTSPVYTRTVKMKTDIINFASGLNSSGSFILICAGG